MAFTVVYFPNEKSILAVPSSWLVDIPGDTKPRCRCPRKNFKDVEEYISNGLPPKDNWALFQVDLKSSRDLTYEQAKRLEKQKIDCPTEDSEDSESDPETNFDEEVEPVPLSSGSSSEVGSEDDVGVVCKGQIPKSVEKTETLKKKKLTSLQGKVRAATTSKDSHEEDGFTAANFMETLKGVSGRMESVERKVESVERKVESVERKVGSVERKVESLERKVESIENKVEEIGVHLTGELTHIKEDLRILVKKNRTVASFEIDDFKIPVKTMQEFEDLEEILKQPEKRTAFIRNVEQFASGSNVFGVVNSIMKTIMEASVMTTFTLKGQRDKRRFMDTTTYKCVLGKYSFVIAWCLKAFITALKIHLTYNALFQTETLKSSPRTATTALSEICKLISLSITRSGDRARSRPHSSKRVSVKLYS